MLVHSTELPRRSRNGAQRVGGKGGKPCALVVSKGTTHKQAEAFAASHFNRPVEIFMVDLLAPVDLFVLGLHAPKHAKLNHRDQQEICLPNKIDWERFELVNIITLFPGAKLNGSTKPRKLLSIHGFSPDEMPKLLKQGLKAFPA